MQNYAGFVCVVNNVSRKLNYGYAVLESEIRKSINSVGIGYSMGFLKGSSVCYVGKL